MVRGFRTFLKYNVLLSPRRRLWRWFCPQSWKLRGVFEMAVTQRAGILDIQPFLKTSCVEEMTARCDHSRFHVLVTDGADVIVLLKLLLRGDGERLDLIHSIPAEKEALPAQLGTKPHVVIGMDEDDHGAHHGPLSKDGL